MDALHHSTPTSFPLRFTYFCRGIFLAGHIIDTRSSFKQWAVITVSEGEHAGLRCSAPFNGSGTPEDVWFKESGESLRLMDMDDEDKVEDGKYWSRVNGDSSIKIYGAKMEDAGMYYCLFSVGTELRAELVELIVEGMHLSKK